MRLGVASVDSMSAEIHYPNPLDAPHLRRQSPEFIALADVIVAVNGLNIPLHSHVLAKTSKVFAQLFSSFAESGATGTASKPTPVTDLFTGEEIATTLLFMVLIYNPDKACITSIFRDKQWGGTGNLEPWGTPRDVVKPPPVAICPNSKITPALLQSVVRLADKLDAQPILKLVEDIAALGGWIQTDVLGWFLEGRKLGLQLVASESLCSIVRTIIAKRGTPSYATRETTERYAKMSVELLKVRFFFIFFFIFSKIAFQGNKKPNADFMA